MKFEKVRVATFNIISGVGVLAAFSAIHPEVGAVFVLVGTSVHIVSQGLKALTAVSPLVGMDKLGEELLKLQNELNELMRSKEIARNKKAFDACNMIHKALEEYRRQLLDKSTLSRREQEKLWNALGEVGQKLRAAAK